MYNHARAPTVNDPLPITPFSIQLLSIWSRFHSSYMTLIGMHEMHGRVYPNKCYVTDLLVVDLRSSLAYFMMTHPLPVAGKLPIKTLVARQLPTNDHKGL